MEINRLHPTPRLAWGSIAKGQPGGGKKGCLSATISITDTCTEDMAVDALRNRGYTDEEIYLG